MMKSFNDHFIAKFVCYMAVLHLYTKKKTKMRTKMICRCAS